MQQPLKRRGACRTFQLTFQSAGQLTVTVKSVRSSRQLTVTVKLFVLKRNQDPAKVQARAGLRKVVESCWRISSVEEGIQVQGPKDVYLGLTGAVLGTIPTAFLYFWAYEWCKKKLEARKQPHALTHILSASAGAIVSAVVRVPTDTLKHRVQAYVLPNIWQVRRLCGRRVYTCVPYRSHVVVC